MTATVLYDNVNQLSFLSTVFNNAAGAATDPTAVSCIITDPSGTSVTHTFAGVAPADVTKPLVGNYALSVACFPAITGIDGLWSFEWIGTGTTVVNNVQPGTFRVLPAPTPNIYCGLEELKDRLGITDHTDDYAAEQAIQAASVFVSEYCGEHFYRITETRTFVPHNIWEQDIDPLVTITALNVDQVGNGDSTFAESWVKDTDYQLKLGRDRYNLNALGVQRPYRKIQVLQSGKWFPYTYPYSHLDRVQVIGTWGWPSVPPPVAQATLELSAEWFKRKDAPFGIAGTGDFGVARIVSNPWLVEMLRPYVNSRFKVGV
jgi:hypothetical protein